MYVWTVFRFQLHVVLGVNYCSNSCLWTEEMTRVPNTLAFVCPNWPRGVDLPKCMDKITYGSCP